jgi:hypothetical protein
VRWPFRYKPQPSDVEGKERAKVAERIAEQMNEHASRYEVIHRDIQRRNNLAPKIHKALGGH